MHLIGMDTKSTKLMIALKKYYRDAKKLAILKSMVSNGSDGISLRLIDWLVTNYSKTHCVVYDVNGKPFCLHQNYKNMLKAYSKRMFDPFRRHNRLYIDTMDGVFETTVAQLTFFRWAIDHKVVKYAIDNKNKIKNDMEKQSILGGQKRKVNGKGTHIYNVNLMISFD